MNQDTENKDAFVVTDSGGYPIFRTMAKELIQKLLPLHSVEGTVLRHKLVSLSATLQGWTVHPAPGGTGQPSSDERHRVINEMIATILNAQEFLGQGEQLNEF